MDSKRELVRNTTINLIRFSKKYERIEKQPIRVTDELSISTRDAHTIQLIGDKESTNVTSVASHFGITRSGASQLVSKLESSDYIEKTPSPHNDKEVDIKLTKLGWTAYEAHKKTHGGDFDHIVESLSKYSLQQLSILSVMLESLDEIMDERLRLR